MTDDWLPATYAPSHIDTTEKWKDPVSMRIEVDEDMCVGGGQCVLAAAEVFDQREEDGVVVLLGDAPRVELHEAVRDAATLCPAAAIRIIE